MNIIVYVFKVCLRVFICLASELSVLFFSIFLNFSIQLLQLHVFFFKRVHIQAHITNLTVRGIARNLLRGQKRGPGPAGSRGRAPVGAWGEAPRSRDKNLMLISSYDGGLEWMSPLATPRCSFTLSAYVQGSSHRGRRREDRGTPKNSGKIFLGKNHVKFGHFVNFFRHISCKIRTFC